MIDEIQLTEKLTCPHCGYKEDAAENEGTGGEWECSNCGEVYEYKVIITVQFRSAPLEERK